MDDKLTTPPPPLKSGLLLERNMVDHHYAHTGTESQDQECGGESDPGLSTLCQKAGEIVSLVDTQLMTLQPGDWSGREWQKVDKKRVDQRVVSAIDDSLVDTWQSLPNKQKTLWCLNCLFYAGK